MVVTENKDFWDAVKPFLTSKGFLNSDDKAIDFDKGTITDNKELSKMFNKYHISISILYKILPVLPLSR